MPLSSTTFIYPLCFLRCPTKSSLLPAPTLHPYFRFSNSIANIQNQKLQASPMKRSAPDYQVAGSDQKMKKIKEEDEDGKAGLMNLDENLLYEVFKHVDARTLARASCVSRLWRQTAKDERLWELICTRHWANIGCGTQQLRSVVLPLGGFRQLHSRYLRAFSKPQAASASSWAPPKIINSKPPARWGKDEVNLCLSLLSIQFYEKMNNRGR